MDIYKVESEFSYKGFRCCVTMPYMARRCGYVGVDSNHPLYGKSRKSYLKGIYEKDIENFDVGKRSTFSLMSQANDKTGKVMLETYFDVHGSITYSDGGKNSTYPISSDLWWFGFDCSHWNDGYDFEEAKRLFSSDLEIVRMIEQYENSFKDISRNKPIRSNQYVRNECKRLADQLYDFAKKYGGR